MQLTEYESRLLYLTKRHGPQDITTVTLKGAADRLIDWQLANYNGAGRLEFIPTPSKGINTMQESSALERLCDGSGDVLPCD